MSPAKRSFKCSQCSNAYTRNGNLKDHVRAKHSNEKPFRCRTCGKTFASKDGCKRHDDRIHLRRTEYLCPVCNVPVSGKRSRHEGSQKHSQNMQNVQAASESEGLESEAESASHDWNFSVEEPSPQESSALTLSQNVDGVTQTHHEDYYSDRFQLMSLDGSEWMATSNPLNSYDARPSPTGTSVVWDQRNMIQSSPNDLANERGGNFQEQVLAQAQFGTWYPPTNIMEDLQETTLSPYVSIPGPLQGSSSNVSRKSWEKGRK